MNLNKKLYYFIHIVCWVLVFLPACIGIPKDQLDIQHIILNLALPINMCIIFYINYIWMVPKLYLNNQYRKFFLINIVLVIILTSATQCAWDILHPLKSEEYSIFRVVVFFIAKKMMSLSVPIVLATLLQKSLLWHRIEERHKTNMMEKKELELRSLKSQIHPHFLLNTLNNIYALIGFNQDKAKEAVISLSELMSQVLYGNEQDDVNLADEVKFIDNYIKLMRLRIPKHVELNVEYDIPDPCTLRVAPLLFMSLVENAFKHGISATEKSVISISMKANDDQICFQTWNTNHPKSNDDNSGHGIGLELVQRRLDIMYPGKYKWTKGITSNNTYSSIITIYDTKLCHH